MQGVAFAPGELAGWVRVLLPTSSRHPDLWIGALSILFLRRRVQRKDFLILCPLISME